MNTIYVKLLMGGVTLEALVDEVGQGVVLGALRRVMDETLVEEQVTRSWLMQGVLSRRGSLRRAVLELVRTLDPSALAILVRDIKHRRSAPRSLRTCVHGCLRALEHQPDAQAMCLYHQDALRYLIATLHLRPSASLQRLLFDPPQRERVAARHRVDAEGGVVPVRRRGGLLATSSSRRALHLLVDTSHRASDAMLEAVAAWCQGFPGEEGYRLSVFEVSNMCRPLALNVRATSPWGAILKLARAQNPPALSPDVGELLESMRVLRAHSPDARSVLVCDVQSMMQAGARPQEMASLMGGGVVVRWQPCAPTWGVFEGVSVVEGSLEPHHFVSTLRHLLFYEVSKAQ